MESTRRSNRSSASPIRVSSSPRSCSTTVLTRTRSLNSVSRCSPPIALQRSTPSQRSSTPPPSKTLIPPRRSPSPASRRISTGSSGQVLNGKRGTSPVKTSHRPSSPKLQGWQSSDPGFSFDAPPNLRTSLSDRPVSRSRGGSPSSFSGLDMNRRGRRQSVSPTPSRRASSSHSNDRDRFSSHSKASATSSAEDDLDSMPSVPVSYSGSSAVRNNSTVMKSRTLASSKKPSKSFSPSSAPKRSFDSAIWFMDHHKAPQDMFRPLLSSVPSTTFGAGKGNDVQRSLLSHNSSLTTGSHASSEHGATFGSCLDKDQEQHVIDQCEATAISIIHEDIFMLDKDVLNEGPSCYQHSLSTTRSGPEYLETVKYAESTRPELDIERSRTSQTSYNVASSSEAGHLKLAACAKCSKLFDIINVEGEVDYCEECAIIDKVSFVYHKIHTLEEATIQDHETTNSEPCITSEAPLTTPGCSEDIKESSLDSQLANDELQAAFRQKYPPSQSTVGTTEEVLVGQHMENLVENMRPHDNVDSSLRYNIDFSSHQCSISDCQQTEPTSVIECNILSNQTGHHHNEMPQCLPESICESIEFVSDTHAKAVDNSEKLGAIGHLNLKAENIEGAGISVLLRQKSTNKKCPVVEGRPLAAANIRCSEPCYTRDSVRMPKFTIGWDSSASSIDQGSSRQSDVHLECRKSSNYCDSEMAQISSTVSCQSITTISDITTSNSSVSLCTQNDVIVATDFLTDNPVSSASRTMTCTEELDGSSTCTFSSAIECWSAAQVIVSDDSELFGGVVIQNQSTGRIAHRDSLSANLCSSDSEHSKIPLYLAPQGSCMQKSGEVTSAIIQGYSLGTPEHPNNECSIDNYQLQHETVLASDEAHKLDDYCVSVISEEDVLVSAAEANTMELPGDVEGSWEQTQRCFALEEATDTILFCSSIVHDIACRAATIGLEHEQEQELASASHSTVSMVGKSITKWDSPLKQPHRRRPRHRNIPEGGIIKGTAEMEELVKDPVHVRPVPEVARTSDSVKPPKIESKCNCVIM